MVAVLSEWHVHHERATGEVSRRLSRQERLILAAHSLAEAYSVLTRLPLPLRLTPVQAWRALDTGFVSRAAAVVALDANGYRQLLTASSADGITGGRLFDALIVACAVAGAVDVLLTFNQGHFEALAGDRVRVAVPT